MFIEQPPKLYRLLYPKAIWRLPVLNEKVVYLTFDDGPIPEITPWVLDLLDAYQIKATFFCVADNVWKHPLIYQMILDRGHHVGNHTFSHIQGIKNDTKKYLDNVEEGAKLIKSNLFRPPHGLMKRQQYKHICKKYKIIMWDVVTRDYNSKLSPETVFRKVKKYTRNGSIIVFHDSLKSEKNMKSALPKSIEWLKDQGYSFKLI